MSQKESRRTFLAGCAATGAAAVSCTSMGSAPGYEPEGPRQALQRPAPMLPPAQAILLTVRGEERLDDEISVVWTFVVNGTPPQVGISVAHEHVAADLVAQSGEFVLNVPTAAIAPAFDRVDMRSRERLDKFEVAGLTRGQATAVDAPTVAEAPIQVECRVEQEVSVPPKRRVFIARVVATTVLPGVVDEDEMLQVDAVPFFGMTAGSGEFYTMGERVGWIGSTKGAARGQFRY